MGRKNLTLLVVAALLMLSGVLGVSTVFAMRALHSTADVVEHGATLPGVFGESTMVRNKNGVSFTINTTQLMGGHPHTIWMFIDEEALSLPGPPGLERFEIRLRVAGGLAGKDGSGHFAGHLSAGTLPPVDATHPKDVLATGSDGSFDDPMGADILLIVRGHGPKIPGMIFEQTHFVLGGCPPNTCVSVQETLHD